MKRRLLVTSLILLTILALNLPTSDAAPPAVVGESPQAMLYRYWNAINLQDYQTAYRMLLAPTRTYEDYVAGFGDTIRIEPYFGEFYTTGAATIGLVQSVLLGYQTDGTVQSFGGCFTVGRSSFNSEWYITGFDLALLAHTVPDAAAIHHILTGNCTTNLGTIAVTRPAEDDATPMLLTYYDAINAGDYATAYAMWLQPLPGPMPNGGPPADYRPPFDQFVNGYQDTAFVNVYPGNYLHLGAAAGRPYLAGYLPAVLVGQHTDGQFVTYAGCYVIGALPSGGPGIVNGRFRLLYEDVPMGDDILTALNLDCGALGIPH